MPPETAEAPVEPAYTRDNGDGAALAAFLAAAIGLLALALAQLGSELSTPFKDLVFAVGKAWIPGAQGIGPYSGKETVMLVAWLGSWAALHRALRGRQPDVKLGFGVALGLLALATLLLWPPVWHALGA